MFSGHTVRKAFLSTGLKKRDHFLEEFAVAVIMLGELIFAVRRQISFADRFQFHVSIQC